MYIKIEFGKTLISKSMMIQIKNHFKEFLNHTDYEEFLNDLKRPFNNEEIHYLTLNLNDFDNKK